MRKGVLEGWRTGAPGSQHPARIALCRNGGAGRASGAKQAGSRAGYAVRRERGRKLIKVARSGSNGTVRVTFALPADEPAGAVSVVGDFNDWNPFSHPLVKRRNGSRSAVVTVPSGSTLHFRYLAEGGIWFDDDTAESRNAEGASIKV